MNGTTLSALSIYSALIFVFRLRDVRMLSSVTSAVTRTRVAVDYMSLSICLSVCHILSQNKHKPSLTIHCSPSGNLSNISHDDLIHIDRRYTHNPITEIKVLKTQIFYCRSRAQPSTLYHIYLPAKLIQARHTHNATTLHCIAAPPSPPSPVRICTRALFGASPRSLEIHEFH